MTKSTSTHPPTFAALAQAFFTEHLQQQRAMSPRTVATYRDGFVLFLQFAQVRLHKQPTEIKLQEITPSLIPGLPRPPRTRSRQLGQEPQRPAGGAARVPEVRRPA